MSYPEFSDFPPIPQRSAAEADFDTKMSALFQHFATTHRAELIALIDFLKTNSTIIGGALNATTVGLDTPAEGKFTGLETPQLDLVNAVSGVLAVLGASASDLNIGTNSNHPVDLRVAGIRSILLSTNGTKSFYKSDGSTVALAITPLGSTGVGTVNPYRLFHVAGGGIPIMRLEDTDADGGYIDVSQQGRTTVDTVAGQTLIGQKYLQLGQEGSSSFAAQRWLADGTIQFFNLGAEAVRLSPSGDLGVGEVNPAARHHVSEPSGTTDVVRSDAPNGSYAANLFTANMHRAANATADFFQAYSGNFADTEFRLRADGNALADGSWTGGGADYAEYFEWALAHLEWVTQWKAQKGHIAGISVVLDGNKIRPAEPGEDPIGVISANPSVVGDGDIDRWKDKYLRDAFGAYILEDYVALRWTETVAEAETVQEQASEAQERTREVIEVVDGVAVKTAVTETVQVPLFDEFPLVDQAGQPIMVATSETLADGSQNIIEVQAVHREPRMAEVQRQTTRDVEHSYAADEVPDGVTVPADAERVTQQRRKLNPDYDPSQDYTPRADRPEWDTVGLMGKLRLLKGQPTGARWIKMRDVSADVEEWLVR
ncbi:peptidase G2 autoproteolytic cleavage domain-containing protein [Phaeobacter gallaeciensis]|uniref:peptidase G2 autoproteolytic cleavage domain-containing protein n=1 Tax=Phaeobacter gallaeciensis TaxID=60890 RepID=UPI00237EEC8D|nr:peptidase G2 autoproteolytic cleavage domain-containing protein [Phaeobacter gallaeciensis]MDE4096739.1 peptidase G2 autoproteolytic cleavage domain-containing protein [Phaeobacter gallaeciensis]MDE4105550.1 peptidase G2 autoproteolytic cleavage domain-containing protein [Phaeobacter gallaeciensis]MDE4110006.1 peptidase G2 autoproteolytic cleavage domain-containing protein [Phaeobacter gallaeciensis]MDE4114474.1 peptidase G2 autoproteolytic cleavage domain-containing protein [Phaeobacter gal